MNEAQGAAATGESEEPTPPPSAADAAPQSAVEGVKTEQSSTGQPEVQPTRLGALLEGMDLPPEVLASVMPKAAEEKKEEEKQPEETEEEQESVEEEEPAPAQAPAAEAAEEEEHVPEEWPQSAKARVAQEAEKRRKWKANAEQLYAELQKKNTQQPTVVPAPTEEDPLANVMDLATLVQVQRTWQEGLDFAEDNPDGAYDVIIKDAQGNPVKDAQGNVERRDYSADDIKEIKRQARPILRAVPGRAEYLQNLAMEAQQAQKVYPEMFQQGSRLNQEVGYLLSVVPEIRRTPEFLMWLGDAMAGRKMRLAKNGQRSPSGKPLSPEAQAILSAPKVTPAPGVIKSRSRESAKQVRGGVDTKQAREAFAQRSYSSEGLDDYVASLRRAQQAGQGPKTKALV